MNISFHVLMSVCKFSKDFVPGEKIKLTVCNFLGCVLLDVKPLLFLVVIW